MTTFLVKNANGRTVFKGIGGAANAWAMRNVSAFGVLFVHYHNDNGTVLKWEMVKTTDIFGATVHEAVCTWV